MYVVSIRPLHLPWRTVPGKTFGLLDHRLNEMTLNWESTYAIALELRRQHPDVNLDEVTLGQIYKWTLGLSEFEDDPSLANDDILYAIYQDWFEENIHGQ